VGDAVVLDAVRTPIGRYGGALASVRPDDLAATVIAEVVKRSGVAPGDIEDVVMGCANQAGEDNRNVARMGSLLAGLPVEVGGSTVNRLCGSGMDAIGQAARAVAVGDGAVFVAGGVESMTRAPWALAKPAVAHARGAGQLEDTALGWRFVNPRMQELGHTDSLGQTAENVADEHGISRAEQDAFALRSQEKASSAVERGAFADEVVPVPTDAGLVDRDEGPRPNTSPEQLARLRPAFRPDGTVTAGNSSPLSDGAAALAIAAADHAAAAGIRPRARILGCAVAGVAPRTMGLGPVPATEKLVRRLGLSLDDFDVIELNEAFAAQAVAVCHLWGIDPEDERLNPNGGAIALGHPLGCSGARLVGALVHELERRPGARLGLATMCIGVGQGIALAVERA